MTTDWRWRSACKDVDPELFFRDSGPVPQSTKDVCAGCQVLIPCTFDALRRPDHGFRAALSFDERARLRRWDRQARQRLAAQQKRASKGSGPAS